MYDGRRTHEPAQARPVWAKDHRHVPGEIDGPYGVGIVKNVRRRQASLTAIFAGPLRLLPDQPQTRAIRVVVDLPGGREEHPYVAAGEEVRSPVRPVEYTDLPLIPV